jgi:steroid delta-isomerase-like uncharacterized protein
MSVESNVAVVRRFIAAVNSGDPAELRAVLADDFLARSISGDMRFGPEAAAMLAGRLQSVPDFRSEIIELIPAGERVVVLGHDTGTPVAEYMGIPATGKGFDVSWVDVYRFANGRITEMIFEMSLDTIRRQMGA